MRRHFLRWPGQMASTTAILAIGLFLYLGSVGDPLLRTSYDLAVCFCRPATPAAVIVYLDSAAARELGQAPDAPWDRRLHARLLERLAADQARAVFYDIVFDSPSPDPAVDAEFAHAIRAQGRVILGAELEVDQQQTVGQNIVFAPTDRLREAAAGWGLLGLEPEADYGVRKLFLGTNDLPSAARVGAETLGQSTMPTRQSWLHYYGRADSIPGIGFAQALSAPAGYFRDKVVIVGGRPGVALTVGKDVFAGPYTRLGGRFYSGVEIHATALLNLLNREWLERPQSWLEITVLVLTALFAGAFLSSRNPLRAALYGLAAMVIIFAVAIGATFARHLWFPWLIPSAVQLPLGIVWAVGSQFFVEARRRAALRRAFSLYLSPHMADRIASSEFDLTPGGKLVEATVLFTDLQGFTQLSEELNDPARLSSILINYFRRTTACILRNEGTIIKYMGDAVEAVWGAPIEQPDHAYRAALAACQLRDISAFEELGRKFRTRIGINSGEAFAGNLGSEFRFDYAVIGDTTNLAARLESLNKRFGTEILLGEATVARLAGRFHTRSLGQFRVAGKARAVGIHELIAPVAYGAAPAWLEIFAAGLAAFRSGDLRAARAAFEQVRATRAGDGPSAFFLDRIEAFEKGGLPEGWDGVLEFDTK